MSKSSYIGTPTTFGRRKKDLSAAGPVAAGSLAHACRNDVGLIYHAILRGNNRRVAYERMPARSKPVLTPPTESWTIRPPDWPAPSRSDWQSPLFSHSP